MIARMKAVAINLVLKLGGLNKCLVVSEVSRLAKDNKRLIIKSIIAGYLWSAIMLVLFMRLNYFEDRI